MKCSEAMCLLLWLSVLFSRKSVYVPDRLYISITYCMVPISDHVIEFEFEDVKPYYVINFTLDAGCSEIFLSKQLCSDVFQFRRGYHMFYIF